VSDSGRTLGDCEHGHTPAYCLICLRARVERADRALAIMMERGWGVHPPGNLIGWGVFAPTASMDTWTFENKFDDPFSALIAADDWWKANVDKT